MATKEQQVKNSFIYLLPVIIGNTLSLVTLPIFTRVLSKEEYGLYALAQVYGLFMIGLANFGLLPVYERNFFQYRDKNHEGSLLYSTLAFVISAFFLLVVFTFFFKGEIAQTLVGSREHGSLLLLALLATGAMNFKLFYLAWFKNRENAKNFIVFTISENLISFILSVVFLVLLNFRVSGLFYAQITAGLIIFIILTFRFTRTVPLSFKMPILIDSLKQSYPLTPKVLFGVIGNQSDKYLIGLISSLGGVGVYSIGQKIANIIFIYMTAIQNVFSPQVFKRMFDKGDAGKEEVGRYLLPFLYISIFLALLVSLFSEEVITVLTPADYHGAIDIVMILAMYNGFMFISKITGTQILFMKKNHLISLMSLITILLTIGFNIPFIKMWGVVGAAWGILAANVLSCGISFFLAQKHYPIRWEYKKVGIIFFILFSASILMMILRDISLDYFLRLTLKVSILAGYLLLGMKTRVVTRENISLVKGIILKKLGLTAVNKTEFATAGEIKNA